VNPAGGPVNFAVGVNETVKFVGQLAVFDGNCADFNYPVTIFGREAGSFKVEYNAAGKGFWL